MKVAIKRHKTRQARPKKPTLVSLQQEVNLLRSAIIGLIGKDDEGEYRPEFVEEILNRSQEKPIHVYTGPGSLLKLLKKV